MIWKFILSKNVLLNWYSSMKKRLRKIRMIFDEENWLWKSNFDSSPLIQNSKFNNFHRVCWFLGKKFNASDVISCSLNRYQILQTSQQKLVFVSRTLSEFLTEKSWIIQWISGRKSSQLSQTIPKYSKILFVCSKAHKKELFSFFSM